MPEVWLHTNRRVYYAGLIAVGLVSVALIAAAAWAYARGATAGLILALVLLPPAAWAMLKLIAGLRRPRLAYEGSELLVYFFHDEPTRVPIDIVEVFFLGQGPSFLPTVQGKEPETQNVIVRLAEAAADWKHRDVPEKLGHWCESYITLRGAWCEPITKDRMAGLNRRLIEVQRERKQQRATS